MQPLLNTKCTMVQRDQTSFLMIFFGEMISSKIRLLIAQRKPSFHLSLIQSFHGIVASMEISDNYNNQCTCEYCIKMVFHFKDMTSRRLNRAQEHLV